MQIKEAFFPEVKIISNFCARDERGKFIKLYNEDEFREAGLRSDFAESYYSVSGKGVIRGMHFQTPPCEHAKLVHVLRGRVTDVIVDLRRDSVNYGKCMDIELEGDVPRALYIPCGFAHGFESLAEDTVMIYCASSGYSRENDCGILWNSIDYGWQTKEPVISQRDRQFPALGVYESPF